MHLHLSNHPDPHSAMAADMTRYLNAVGRVRRVLPDGRAEVAVMVH